MPKNIILRNHQSPGDIVMMAYAIKALHEQYPRRYRTDVSVSCRDIFEGNPFISDLSGDATAKVYELGYPLIHKSNQYPVHFIHSFVVELSRLLGIKLDYTEFQGSIYIREEEKHWTSVVRDTIGKDVPYWVIDAGHKTDYTAKAWDFRRYQEIINRFPEITFVQIGLKHHDHIHPELYGNNLINLIGKTDTRQLIRLIYNAFGVITPVSFPMVLAYAVPPHPRFNRKSRACIVIAGGREPNHWQQGPNQQFLHTCGMLSCCDFGGCWVSRVKPIGDGDEKDHNNLCQKPIELANGQVIAKCMEMITTDQVCNLIKNYMNNLAFQGMEQKVEELILAKPLTKEEIFRPFIPKIR